MDKKEHVKPVIGFNISGLLFNNEHKAEQQYHLHDHYRTLVYDSLRELLSKTDSNIVLVPHVITKSGNIESDYDACKIIEMDLHKEYHNRITVAPCFEDPRKIKWIIGKMDWFCGTRMHSTIASLSSGVPTMGFAYSPKMSGVFNTCGSRINVADLRTMNNQNVIKQMMVTWKNRKVIKKNTIEAMNVITQQISDQFDLIVEEITESKQAAA